jgi:asparagine synthase (glutamine-hydrolysing)
MCGITGFIDFNKLTKEGTLNSMINVLSHRGPDGTGTHFVENKNYVIGIGHKRLSIIDLRESASQPMSFGV